jgi:NADH-quinone oxidoreductase subunit J
MAEIVLFYFLAAATVAAAVGVVMHENPLLCALHLVLSMLGVAGLFFLLQAPFVGAVQIMVYAGAVMVLFVLVLMLIDTNKDDEKFSGGNISALTKGLSVGVLSGLLTSIILRTPQSLQRTVTYEAYEVIDIAKLLFTKYVLAFELLGVLLLVIPVGVVALSRIRGGTHDR